MVVPLPPCCCSRCPALVTSKSHTSVILCAATGLTVCLAEIFFTKLVSYVEGKTACGPWVQQRSKDEQTRGRRCAARIWVLKLMTEIGPPLLRALWGTIVDWIEDRRRAYRGYCLVCSSFAVGALSMRCALVFELFSSGQSGETGTRTQHSVCGTPSVRAVYVLLLL